MPKKKTTKSMTEAEIKARKEAQKRYVQTLELVSARLPLGTKKQITDLGYNVTQFINEAIASYLSTKKAASEAPALTESTKSSKPVNYLSDAGEYEDDYVADSALDIEGANDNTSVIIKEKSAPVVVSKDLSISRSPDWKGTKVSPEELKEFLAKARECSLKLSDEKPNQVDIAEMYNHIWIRMPSNQHRLSITDYMFEKKPIDNKSQDFVDKDELRLIIKSDFATFYSEALSLPAQRFYSNSTFELFNYFRYNRDVLEKITFFYKKSDGNREKFMKSYSLSDLKKRFPICYVDYNDILDLFYITFFCNDGLLQLNMYRNLDLKLSNGDFYKALEKIKVTNPLFFLRDGMFGPSNVNSTSVSLYASIDEQDTYNDDPRNLSNQRFHPFGWSIGIKQYTMKIKVDELADPALCIHLNRERAYILDHPFPKPKKI